MDCVVEVILSPDAVQEEFSPGTVPTAHEQTFAIESRVEGDKPITRVTAEGVLGAAYGLFRVADRIRTRQPWPPADERCQPAFPQRFCGAGFRVLTYGEGTPDREATLRALEGSVTQFDAALAMGATTALVMHTDDLVDWGVPQFAEKTAVAREAFTELLREAHARRLRVYAMGDEFLYVREWLERTGAKLSTDDPALWEAMKSKYRGVLAALPELDGIATRTGEVIPKGDILAWDIIHTGEDRSLEASYRRFLQAMHEVVVGEFGRQYFHRTWMVNVWEQASVPEIYARTFEGLPTNDFMVSIKATTGDQWEWQPLNPTFGQAEHATAVQIETLARAGLLHRPARLRRRVRSGCCGMGAGAGREGLLLRNERPLAAALGGGNGVRHLAAGVEPVPAGADAGRRLGYAPWSGPNLAERVADILLDTDDVYRDGFHIRGMALNTWEPLRHVRKGWVCFGNPFFDDGKGTTPGSCGTTILPPNRSLKTQSAP